MRVYPSSRIARLQHRLRFVTLLARNPNSYREKTSKYVFEADGLATVHYSPFLDDSEWSRRYDHAASSWFTEQHQDVRWRMWLLTEFARRADGRGAFAEFGVYRGACSYMTLASTTQSEMWLFDTFSGIPERSLTEGEAHLVRFTDTSVEHVAEMLGEWNHRTRLVAGDVFDTLATTETGRLSLVHMDLNAAAPTQFALDYVYPRLVPGGVIVFDDYGWAEYVNQRTVIDEFFVSKPERVIALPTGQAMTIKL